MIGGATGVSCGAGLEMKGGGITGFGSGVGMGGTTGLGMLGGGCIGGFGTKGAEEDGAEGGLAGKEGS